jgi:hypothetical protein
MLWTYSKQFARAWSLSPSNWAVKDAWWFYCRSSYDPAARSWWRSPHAILNFTLNYILVMHEDPHPRQLTNTNWITSAHQQKKSRNKSSPNYKLSSVSVKNQISCRVIMNLTRSIRKQNSGQPLSYLHKSTQKLNEARGVSPQWIIKVNILSSKQNNYLVQKRQRVFLTGIHIIEFQIQLSFSSCSFAYHI